MRTKQDWQAALGTPSAAFDAKFQQTLNQLEEQKMKRFTLRTGILVFALMLALAATALALTGAWDVGGYLSGRYHKDVPQEFTSGYDGAHTQNAGGVTFAIRDAYIENGALTAIVTARAEDGAGALFLCGDISQNDTVDNLFIDGREDGRTIAQYTKENGLRVYSISTRFEQGGVLSGGLDVWLESDGTTAMAVTAENIAVENGQARLVWHVLTETAGGEAARSQTEITLKADSADARTVAVNRRLADLPVTVECLRLTKGALGTSVEVDFAIAQDATKAQLALVQDIWFELIDPATGERVPEGASTSGAIDERDSLHLTQRGLSIAPDWAGDTLTLRAYDAFEKTRYGSIDVIIAR